MATLRRWQSIHGDLSWLATIRKHLAWRLFTRSCIPCDRPVSRWHYRRCGGHYIELRGGLL